MELEVLTPVHIGGVDYKNKLGKKEYIYNFKNKTLTIIDNAKFIQHLENKNLFNEYVNYIIDNVNSKNQKHKNFITIEAFLKEKDIIKDLKLFTKKEYKNFKIDTKNGRLNDINLLNTDIFGNAYIQGSSIKGALEGLLLVDYILRHREEFAQQKKRILLECKMANNDFQIRKLKKNISKIIDEIHKIIIYKEDKIFEKTKKFGISISDSYKIQNNSLSFFQDIDYNIEKQKENPMPLVREYIMPETKFDFDLTLDLDLLDKSKLNIKSYDDLIKSLENANDYLIDKILKVNTSKNENLILGANTGFLQKTIVHALFENEKERLEVTRKLLHKKKSDGKNKKADAINDHLGDTNSPRVINGIYLNGKFQLAGLVKIKKIGEKNVGTN